jgi:Glycosyltransferase family 87
VTDGVAALRPAAAVRGNGTHPALPRTVLAGAAGLAIVVAVAEHLLRGNQYWDYSEGVYVYTSRLFLHGHDLYGNVVAAQPPPLFLVGAVLLAVHDSLGWMRAAIGAVQVGTAVLAAAVVWRIVGSRAAAVAAAPLSLLTPWAVHEHGSLIPEMLAAPLLLGGVLLARDRRRAPWLGLCAALLATVKLSYALPAVALVAVSADWRRAARWAVGAVAVEAAVAFAVFGGGLWRDVVVAQVESGHVPLHSVAGELAQIAWHLVGLILAAALAWRYRRGARDARTLRVAAMVAVATLVTLVSIWKQGTSLNSVVPAEVTLVPLAVSGIALALASPRPRRLAALGAAGVAFAVVQALSLVVHPLIVGARPIHPFLRPGSGPSYGVTMTASEVNRAVADARRCPAGVPYSGTPEIAFIAHRPMAGDQPDQYLIHLAPTLKAARAAIAAEPGRCPAQAPATH